MKKVISLIVALAIVACCVVSASAAVADVVWTGSKAEVNPGETVILEWSFHFNGDETIGAFNSFLKYDTDALELKSQSKKAPDDKSKAFTDNSAGMKEAEQGGYTLEWNGYYAEDTAKGGFMCADGLDSWANDIWLFNCQFQVKPEAKPGAYTIELTFDPFTNASTTQKKDLTWASEDAVITVKGTTPQPSDADAVIALIAALPEPADVALTDEPAINAARAAYEALGTDDKAKVTNYQKLQGCEAAIEALNKAAAAAVDAQIAALPAVGDITLNDEPAVQAARAAYTALTEAQKGYVEKLADLEAAEAKIVDLKAAASVIDEIAALADPTFITEADKAAVAAARASYNALTPAQQALVTNYAKLEACEKAIAELNVTAVINAINALPEVADITLDDEVAVDTVKNAFDELSPEDQAKVTNKQKLLDAVAKIAALKEQADKDAAAAVDAQIAALPAVGDITLDDEPAINAARAAYEALSESAKGYVTKKADLQAAEGRIAALKAAKAQAKVVDDQIAALPATAQLTLNDKAAVEAARNAVTALSEDAKGFLNNLTVLAAAENRIAQLETAKEQAAAVDAQIAALPATDKLTLADKAAVEAARAAATALSEDAWSFLNNVEKLAAAENRIAQLETAKEQAAAVDAQIAALPAAAEITLANEDAVKAARTAYEALSADAKGFVENLAALEAAEKAIADLKDIQAATAVSQMIDELPEADKVALTDKEAINAARAAYDALTATQKALVNNYDKLVADEEALAKLQPSEPSEPSSEPTKPESKVDPVNPGKQSDNYKTGDASAVAVAGALCAAMAVAFVFTKKKFH